MLLRQSMRSRPRAEARGAFAPFGVPLALSWALLAYAAVAVAAFSAFAALRIHADYLQVMQGEAESLRGVTAALTSTAQAMLYDGMGAGRSAVSEIRATGGLDRGSASGVAAALQRNLTGGAYVRSLFVLDPGHFVLASGTRVLDGASAPGYLAGLATADEVWVGAPMSDPENPARWVVPLAQREQTGPGSSGWVGALLSFASLEQLRQRFGGVVSEQGLVGYDGTILASVGNRYNGRNVSRSPLFRRGATTGPRGGIVEGPGEFTHKTMISAYSPLQGYPILVVAG